MAADRATAEQGGRERLERASLAELHALAAELGVRRYRLLRRDALIEAITRARERSSSWWRRLLARRP